MTNSGLRTLGFLALASSIIGLGYLMVTHYDRELELFLEGVLDGLETV